VGPFLYAQVQAGLPCLQACSEKKKATHRLWHNDGAWRCGVRQAGARASSLMPAMTVVLPIFTSAELSAVLTAPSAMVVGRARASGRPSGRRPSATKRA